MVVAGAAGRQTKECWRWARMFIAISPWARDFAHVPPGLRHHASTEGHDPAVPCQSSAAAARLELFQVVALCLILYIRVPSTLIALTKPQHRSEQTSVGVDNP